MSPETCNGPELNRDQLPLHLAADPEFRAAFVAYVTHNNGSAAAAQLEEPDFRHKAAQLCIELGDGHSYPPKFEPGTLFDIARRRFKALQVAIAGLRGADSAQERYRAAMDLNEANNGPNRGGVRELGCPRLVGGNCVQAMVHPGGMGTAPDDYVAVPFKVPCPYFPSSRSTL